MSRTLHLLSCALLPVTLALSACARHIGRPEGDPPRRQSLPVEVERDVPFTPADWPAPLLSDFYLPQGSMPEGGWPATLMIHGGGWNGGDRAQVAGLARRVAKRGYVVMNLEYRLVPGARFPAQLQDVQQAVIWLRSHAQHYRVNPQRIAAWGYSAGAHLAALVGGIGPGDRLFVEGSRVQAVVAGGTPADLRKFHGGTLVPEFLGERWKPESVVFRESSPAAYVTPDDPPVFLYHGTWDHLVPLDQATDYKAALDAAGVPNELYLLRGLGHIPAFLLDGEAVQCGADFLDRQMSVR